MSVCKIEYVEGILETIDSFLDYSTTEGSDTSLEALNQYVGEKSPDLSGDFTLSSWLVAYPEEFGEEFKYKVELYGLDINQYLIGIENSTLINTKSNVSPNLSTIDTSYLFHTLPMARNMFEGFSTAKIVQNILLGRKTATTFVFDNETASNNLHLLKKDLFNTLQNFILDKKLIPGFKKIELYEESGDLTDYNHYMLVLNTIDNYFFSGDNFKTINSVAAGKKVPMLPDDINANQNLYNVYNSAVLLSNFDTVLYEYFSIIVDIDFNLFNNLKGNLSTTPKYKINIEGLKTKYFKTDDHNSESSESAEVKLVKMLVSTIPYFNKKGEYFGQYMKMDNFYLFAAQISDFELLYGNKLRNKKNSTFKYFVTNPKERLLWYLDEIISAINGEPGSIPELKEIFRDSYEFAISLKKYIKVENILKKDADSKGLSVLSIFGQIVNNNYGANYSSYTDKGKLTIRNAYKVNFTSIALQNSIFNHFKKVANTKIYEAEKVTEDLNLIIKDEDDVLKLTKNQKVSLAKFIKPRLGFTLSYIGIQDFIEAWEKVNPNRTEPKEGEPNKLTTTFKTALISFVTNTLKTNQEEVAKLKDDVSENAKGDVEVANYISDVVKDGIYKAIEEAYLLNYPVEPIMVLETADRNKIPTFKLATLTYKDTELFEQQRELESNPNYGYQSLLLKGRAIIGTGTKLELINKATEKSKSGAKFTPAENFMTDFQIGFLKGLSEEKKDKVTPTTFAIQIGAYSDKNTILTKIIDAYFSDDPEKKPILQRSQEELLELFREQNYTYYKSLLKNLFADYDTLLDLGIDEDTFEENFEKYVDLINGKLSEINITDLSLEATKLGIKLTQEASYSKYGKRIALNQTILDNYRIFKDKKAFKKFVKNEEDFFIDKFKKNYREDNNTNKNKFSFVEDTNLSRILELTGLTKEDFIQTTKEGDEDSEDKSERGKPKYNALKINGELNPLIKKWLWINALYRNEYLYLSAKGEYMHPHKGDKKGVVYRGSNPKVDFNAYNLERSLRLAAMSKRNVLFTATIDVPVRQSQYGIPENINIAAIEDYKVYLANIADDKKGQDVHDGSSFINYAYSRMVDASYPLKGYKGTKKQFGTFVSDYGVLIKKDAENVITNKKIINSSAAELNLRYKQEQMLGIEFLESDIENFKFDEKFNNQYFFNEGGVNYKINSLQLTPFVEGTTDQFIKTPQLLATMTVFKKIGNDWDSEPKIIKQPIEKLYDLWTLFGAEYSTDSNGEFNEGSNDLLYQVITTPASDGTYPLKDKLIHVLSNTSALKAGAVNVNDKGLWKTNSPLAYGTFKNRFIGPQLDASHEADDSEIKEITQVISALAQNSDTYDLSQEAYNDIANVIKTALEPFLNKLNIQGNLDRNELYKYMSERFVKTILHSKGDNIAKILVQSFTEDKNIPFSNQNFFVQFVRDIITRMNNDFITRYYSGMGGILIPSHGIVKLIHFDGKTAQYEDLAKEALSQPSPHNLSNREIVEQYIQQKLRDEEISSDMLQIGDSFKVEVERQVRPEIIKILEDNPEIYNTIKTLYQEELNNDLYKEREDVAISHIFDRFVKWNYGKELPEEIDISNFNIFSAEDALYRDSLIDTDFQIYELDSPEKYYYYKKQFDGQKVWTSKATPRDLKPTDATWTNSLGIRKSLWDLDGVRLRYKLKIWQDKKIVDLEDSDYTIPENFARYITKIDDLNLQSIIQSKNTSAIKIIDKKLFNLIQRSLQLLEKESIEMTSMNPLTDFNEYFSLDEEVDNLEDIFDDVVSIYRNKEDIVTISNYNFQPAEMIMGNIYQTVFDMKATDSLYDVKKQGPDFFLKKLLNKFEIKEEVDFDLKLEVDGLENPVYIKYVDKLPGNDSSLPFRIEHVTENGTIAQRYVRKGRTGEDIYRLYNPQEMRAKLKDGKEIIYVKAFNVVGKTTFPERDFEKHLQYLINSFGNNIKAIIPGMVTSDQFYKANKKHTKDLHVPLASISYKVFSRFYNYYAPDMPTVVNKQWFDQNKLSIFENIAKKQYASWEKSLDFIAARIPSQSMQSFMPMRVVGYTGDNTNDVYVSVMQILLQGSDFDVDKAYILGTGFKNNGIMDLWTNAFRYTTSDQLTAIEKLPLPSKIKIESLNKGLNLSEEFAKFVELIKGKDISYDFDVETINLFNKVIRKVNKAGISEVNLGDPQNMFLESARIFISTINKHNANESYLKSKHAIKNSVVSRIKGIISAPSNQLLANIPVDVKVFHDAVDDVNKRRREGKLVQGIEELFESNPELANAVYEVLGFKNDYNGISIELGRSVDRDFGKVQNIIVSYNGKPITSQDGVAGLGEMNIVIKDGEIIVGFIRLPKEYQGKGLTKYIYQAVADKLGLPIVNSKLKGYNQSESGGYVWKNRTSFQPNQITPQQKQQAQQLYSQYVEQTGKQDIEGFTKFVKKSDKSDKSQEIMSPYDMFSYYIQQRDAAVGKEDVGIAANGLKVFFALSSYYNNYYANSFDPENVRLNSKTFKKEFTLTLNGERKVMNIVGLSDVRISKAQKETLKNAKTEGEIFNSLAALALSAFTSAATDNAKELLMAKLNANTDLAAMHIYLMMLGFTPEQLVEIMTSDIIEELVEKLEVNMFYEDSKNPEMILGKMLSNEEDPLKKADIQTYIDIFQGGKEITILSRFLAANQRTAANIDQIYKFLSNFETAMFTRENTIFGNDLKKFNEWMTKKDSRIEAVREKAEEDLNSLVKQIIAANPLLNDEDTENIKQFLEKASNVKVSAMDTNGQRYTKTVSIIGGNFDFRYYIDRNTENDEYRKLTQEYYNLIKNTFNVFDVIETVPHFKEMINGVIVTHQILMNTSYKYNFIYNILKDTVKNNFNRIISNEHIKNQFGNDALAPVINDVIIRKVLPGLDMRLKSAWLKSEKLDKYSFNVTDLLRTANSVMKEPGATIDPIPEIYIYTNDNAWKVREEDFKNKPDGIKLVKLDDTEDTVINLKTNHGIASFKRIMETLILPILQDKSSEFADSLKVQLRGNVLGLKSGMIMSTHSLGNMANPVSRDKAQKLIRSFNLLDINLETKGLIKNDVGTELKWRDLFYMYNLFVNNERYGGTTLTPLFEDYMKEQDSVGFDYISFSSKMDSGEINLLDINEILKDSAEYQDALDKDDQELIQSLRNKANLELVNDILFYAFNKRGLLSIDKNQQLSVVNGDFVTITGLTETVADKKIANEEYNIIKLIKEGGFIINFECI